MGMWQNRESDEGSGTEREFVPYLLLSPFYQSRRGTLLPFSEQDLVVCRSATHDSKAICGWSSLSSSATKLLQQSQQSPSNKARYWLEQQSYLLPATTKLGLRRDNKATGNKATDFNNKATEFPV